MRCYKVNYRMHFAADEKQVEVVAKNKFEAYDWATYEVIPAVEGSVPYSSWVSAVLYANGKTKDFNTTEGNGY